ncbi:MAG: carbohydrate-binding protein [Verrucomicrobia bacterium]|nr:carbohydrate-binding protein [Verrucomicrobiota bacterium]
MHLTSSMLLLALAGQFAAAAEFHVSVTGNDRHDGTASHPFRTLSAAARAAWPGDVITVHQGTYRERVNPPRGGESNAKRIVYRAAPGEPVEIKGSEIVTGWSRVRDAVWTVTLPNAFFGEFNPYRDRIRGDWFNGRGREHHTGAVYLNGDWLIEAAALDDVMLPPGTRPAWLARSGPQYLLNVAWLRPVRDAADAGRIPATRVAARKGTQNAPCVEGGECLGFIEHGHWVRYDAVDFGSRTEQIEFRAASASEGGVIEIRLDTPEGERLGSCAVRNTGDWQAWASFTAPIRPVGGTRVLCLVFLQPKTNALSAPLWFARVDGSNTTLWAQFPGADPNREQVEINVRRTVFYPDRPGRNFITVRGFAMRQAATPWAPPTAEQVGLIGTHWSKGWIIEDNVISHSICSGIALGKHGDAHDNTSADTAEGYVKTIERAHAHAIPWTRATIGHHIVRNNTIAHCEQAGVVGSLGAAFSTVTGNTIHHIHVRRLFTGAEMAGIKFHAAIDTLIRSNHIHHACRGLWLDWMTQGTRVSANLFHDNTTEDLFVEVNHGPFVVDNNLFLSATSLLDMSEGGAYAHNLFAGKLTNRPEPSRNTPYHPPHSTTVAGLIRTRGGDNRFYNNIFVGDGAPWSPARKGDLKAVRWISSYGLWGYDGRELPLHTAGNVYCHGAEPYARETAPTVVAAADLQLALVPENGRLVLHLSPPPPWAQAPTAFVTTALLGHAATPGLPYENPDGSPLKVDTDYFGKPRSQTRPTPGPFEHPGPGRLRLTVRER